MLVKNFILNINLGTRLTSFLQLAVCSLQSANVDIALSLGVLVLVSLQSENIKHQTLINIDRK